jgi:tripartite ATP-independent transporter DctM subunit
VLILVADMLQGVNQTAQLALGNLAPEPVSVGDLFAGAFLPGLLLVLLFLLWVAARAWADPLSCPPLALGDSERRDLRRRVVTALVFPSLLVVGVLGSILAGVATATESASIGAVGALLFAAFRRRLDLAFLHQVCLRTAFTSAMIFVILFGASVFSLVFRGLGGEVLVEEGLRAMPGGSAGAMAVFMALMFVLGFFLDTFEIIFIMIPIFGPPLLTMGLDPVWLGVMVALNLQTSFLTPPFGATLFYQRSATPPEVSTGDIWRGSITPTLLQLAALALVWLFPALATWLPGVLLGGG